MLNIKVDKDKATASACDTNINVLLAELTIGIKAVYEGVEEHSEKDAKFFRKMFDGCLLAKPLFMDAEEFAAEQKRMKNETLDEVIKLAEDTLVDDDNDKVGKAIVEALKKILEDV